MGQFFHKKSEYSVLGVSVLTIVLPLLYVGYSFLILNYYTINSHHLALITSQAKLWVATDWGGGGEDSGEHLGKRPRGAKGLRRIYKKYPGVFRYSHGSI